jgi:hypothetical protein
MIKSDVFGYLYNDAEPAFTITSDGSHYYHLKTKRLFKLDELNALLAAEGKSFGAGEVGSASDKLVSNREDLLQDALEDTVPVAPTSASVTANGISSMLIQWTDNSNGEAGFRIERSKETEDDFKIVGSTAPEQISFVDNDTALENGVLYEYNVYAFNIAGSSTSANASGTTDIPA